MWKAQGELALCPQPCPDQSLETQSRTCRGRGGAPGQQLGPGPPCPRALLGLGAPTGASETLAWPRLTCPGHLGEVGQVGYRAAPCLCHRGGRLLPLQECADGSDFSVPQALVGNSRLTHVPESERRVTVRSSVCPAAPKSTSSGCRWGRRGQRGPWRTLGLLTRPAHAELCDRGQSAAAL